MGEILAEAGTAVLSVAAVGIILGAGLPALYALGMRSLAIGRTVTADGHDSVGAVTPLGRAGAIVCFALVIAAALFGIVVIIFGKQLFGH